MASRKTSLSERSLKVKQALENPKYKWRTIEGITNDTKLPVTEIKTAFDELRLHNILVKSSRYSKNGMELFTTREHFEHCATLLEKLSGLLKNRVD